MSQLPERGGASAVAVKWMVALACGCLVAWSSSVAEGLPLGLALKAEVGCGYDTNIFRQPDTTSADRSAGSFIPYRVKLSYEIKPARGSRARLSYEGDGQFYLPPHDKGGYKDNLAIIHYDRRLAGWSEDSLSYPAVHLEARAFWADRHLAYTSRSTGEEISAHKGHLNWGELGGAVQLWARWPASMRWEMETKAFNRNYEEAGDIEPLDHDNLQLLAAVSRKLGEVSRLRLEYTRSRSNYREVPARDFDGNEIPGSKQKFRYETWRTELLARVYVPYGLSVTFTPAVQYKVRDDISKFESYQFHYLDYSELGLEPVLEIASYRRWKVEAALLYANRTYDRARTGYIPFHPLRHDLVRDWSVRFILERGTAARFFAEVFVNDNDEVNPLYTYSRTRSSIGYQFSL